MPRPRYFIIDCPIAATPELIQVWNAKYLSDPKLVRPSWIRSPFWRPLEPVEDEIDDTPPFRLMDLPYEIRQRILYLAIGSSDDYFLDREVIRLGHSLRSYYYHYGRFVWRGADPSYLRLLTVNKEIHYEVQQVLFSHFAFDAIGWGYMLKYSDPSKTLNRIPKYRIKHIVYTPHCVAYMRQHRDAVRLILSSLPMLCTVRIMVTTVCATGLIICDNTKAGTQHVVAVAQLFKEVGKVAVVGQSLYGDAEKGLVEEAREELKEECWYWDIPYDYALFLPNHESFL